MPSDLEMGNKCLKHRVAATKRISQREIKMLK